MATQFAEITLEEMDRFIKRGWRALRPKHSIERGVNIYDLFLSKFVMIRVWTTIRANRETVRDVGETTIKVQLLNARTGRPLTGSEKALFAKRVLGWKNNLQDRIEDYIEMYEEREDYFEGLAGNHVPAEPSKPSILDDGHDEQEEDEGNRAERELAEREMREEATPPPSPRPTNLRATFQRLRNGDWGLRVYGDARPGDRVLAETKGGKKQYMVVGDVVWRGDGVTVTTIVQNPRTAGEMPDLSAEDDEREA